MLYTQNTEFVFRTKKFSLWEKAILWNLALVATYWVDITKNIAPFWVNREEFSLFPTYLPIIFLLVFAFSIHVISVCS